MPWRSRRPGARELVRSRALAVPLGGAPPALVADVEKQLTEQPLHVLVERMCVVGNSWPLCLARAAAKAHEAQRLLRKGALREKKKKQRKQETQGQGGRQKKGRAKRNHRDLARKLRARVTAAEAAATAGTELDSDWDKLVAEAGAAGQADGESSGEPGLPSAP